jgi:hypothetical protein
MRIFLDDERFPVDDTLVVFRTAESLLQFINHSGVQMISFISFDHDLGEGLMTGYDLVNTIVDLELSGKKILSDDFSFYVHSQNPVGKRNIEMLLDNYIVFKNRPKDR